MKKILWGLACLLTVGTGTLRAQTIVSGIVTEAGQPLAGASVSVKGTTTTVLTDGDGRYAIHTPDNATLVFSFIGLRTQEIETGARTVINVSMDAEAMKLEDVVVIGYGSGRKISGTVGSIARVSSDKIAGKPVANMMDALQGRVAGLQVFNSSGEPSSLPSMRLHGMGSFLSGNEPLYVVDGVPVMKETILALNAGDFESVTVLKDASATSIYGSRAANGVMYITTKRGKTGEALVSARMQYGVSMLAEGKQAFNVMNAKELLALQLEYGINNMTPSKQDSLLRTGIDTKWYQYFYKSNVPTIEGDVSIQGGAEKIKYYFSGSYFDQRGLTLHSGYERYAIRANIDAMPKQWLKTGLNLSGSYGITEVDGYTYQGSSNPNSFTAQSYNHPPYYSPYDENGNEKEYFDDLGNYNGFYAEKMQSDLTNTTALNGRLFVEIKPLTGLIVRSQFGLDFRDVRRSYTLLPSARFAKGSGMVREDFYRYPTLTVTNTIEYTCSIATDHALTWLVGQEGIQNTSTGFSMITDGQTDDRLLLLSTGTNKYEPKHDISQYAYLSFFGMANYNWKEKYFVDLSLRNDASSRFGASRRRAFFYSLGAMWNVKKENFLEDVDELSALSAKVSFGTTGNSDISYYEHLATINGELRYNKEAAWALGKPGNSELGWETQQLLTVGVKAELFEKIKAEIEFYHRQTLDMLMNVPYPYSTGWSAVPANIGSMNNTGFDATVGVTWLKTSDWLVETHVMLNYNRNKVVELFYGMNEWILPESLLGFVVGQPISFYLPVYAGVNLSNGRPLWNVPGTNKITEIFSPEALSQLTDKPYMPVWSGGLEVAASWKGIFASVFFSWIGDKYMINNDRYFYENSRFLQLGNNQSKTMQQMWRKPGDVTDIPKFGENAQFDSHLLENASFLRLKNLSVGYVFPKSWLVHTKFFDGAKVYFTARNLLTVTSYTGPDPEVDSNLSRYTYPSTRQFTVSLEFSF